MAEQSNQLTISGIIAFVPHTVGRPVFEVAVTFSLILLAVWTARPQQDWIALATFIWIVLSSVFPRENTSAVRLGFGGLQRALWIIPAALVFAALQIIVANHEQTLHAPFTGAFKPSRLWGYVIWSFLQQFILQDYFLLRLLRVLRPSAAIVASATLFAAAHLPNPILTVATFLWGLAACMLFLHYRDIYSLGFAHAVFGLTLAICIPASVHHNMRVGLGYLRYHPQPAAQSSQIPHRVSTEAWVIADAGILRSALHARP